MPANGPEIVCINFYLSLQTFSFDHSDSGSGGFPALVLRKHLELVGSRDLLLNHKPYPEKGGGGGELIEPGTGF